MQTGEFHYSCHFSKVLKLLHNNQVLVVYRRIRTTFNIAVALEHTTQKLSLHLTILSLLINNVHSPLFFREMIEVDRQIREAAALFSHGHCPISHPISTNYLHFLKASLAASN